MPNYSWLCFTCSQITPGDTVTGLPTSRTHRGPCQDQERPQLLSEVGHPQTAQPAALRGDLQTSGPRPGLLASLHVPTAGQPGSEEAGGGISAGLTSLPSLRPGPPSLRPQPARSSPAVPSQLNARRASAILDTSLAPPHRCERPQLRQSLEKLWKQTESYCGCSVLQASDIRTEPALRLPWVGGGCGSQGLKCVMWKDLVTQLAPARVAVWAHASISDTSWLWWYSLHRLPSAHALVLGLEFAYSFSPTRMEQQAHISN